MTIKNTVAQILERDERCRNNDTWLIIETLRELGYNIYVPYGEIKDMPSFETITRCRRLLQADKSLNNMKRANPDVERFREARQARMRETLGEYASILK